MFIKTTAGKPPFLAQLMHSCTTVLAELSIQIPTSLQRLLGSLKTDTNTPRVHSWQENEGGLQRLEHL